MFWGRDNFGGWVGWVTATQQLSTDGLKSNKYFIVYRYMITPSPIYEYRNNWSHLSHFCLKSPPIPC